MRSFEERLERLTTEETAVGGGGSTDWGDLGGLPTDNADFVSEITTLEDADTALGVRVTANEGLLAGNLTDIASLSLSQDNLLYENAGSISALALGTNLSITAGVLNAASGGGGGATELNELSDVVLASPTIGDVLQHDGNDFVNVPLDLSVISDVDMTGVSVGDVLRWDGSDMVPGSAIAATENLIAIRGSVDSAGTKDYGSGFTVTKMGTGDYRINFDTPFSTVPSCVATIRNDLGGADDHFIRVCAESTTSFRVKTYDGSAAVDQGFCFVGLGV